SGIAVDPAGNVYIADQFNDCIRKVNTGGTISTIAGTGGTAGFSGDGSFAVAALLDHPWSICLDRIGNLYIADQNNNRIRKVDLGGTITTIAGNGFAGYTGDGGQATNCRLNQPLGVAADTLGNIFIADYGNNVIRKINGAGVISTYAGTGGVGFSGDKGPATVATLNAPSGVMMDRYQNLYISDGGNNRIRIVNPNDSIFPFAGTSPGFAGDGGPATAAELNLPYATAIDGYGNIFIADAGNQRVREINSPAGINELKNKTSISVYPNPTGGKFQLVMSNDQLGSKGSVYIYNMLGQNVYSQKLSIVNSQLSIDLSSQPEGIYMLRVQTGDGNTLVSKVAITR
ncbi:MAG TPA: T9SS type A sorting domain-containing protein, partial [Bacteroidia bacterium]|nr:T9SS type A sorting domain-containing protein [Bacteroidia bacterium]